MEGRRLRGAVVGASTLLGKELAEELNDSITAAWDITLLDTAEAGGQITSAGDEALVIQAVSADTFQGVDVVFFAGDAATARKYWKDAHAAGASIVDMTGALEGLPGVLLRSIWAKSGASPDLTTVALATAHPMAAVFTLIETKLQPMELKRLVATVMVPASELGSAGVDELQQQAVGLLTFKPLQKNVYDAQVAFNLLVALGGAAKLDLEKTRTLITRQAAALGGEPGILALQVVQAPVFHGYTASVFAEIATLVDEAGVREALAVDVLQFVDEISPSNESAAGATKVLFSLQKTEGGFWFWIAADNLRLAARNAAGCAQEFALLRPPSAVN